MPATKSTIADVARRAGVSIATVSRVLNHSAPVVPEMAERVRTVIKELNYRPHTAARILATRRTDTIGLLLPEISGDYFQPMLRGVETGARQAGFDLLIHVTEPLPEGIPHRHLGEHNADGLVIFPDSIDDQEIIRLHTIGLPIVMMYQSAPEQLNIPFITIENKSGTHKIVSHFIEAHHYRRIAFLRGPEGNDDSELREKGYREAMAAHGLPVDEALIARGNFTQEDGRLAVQGWLNDGLRFEAIAAGDDDSAIGAMLALQEAGLRIPQDVAVAGFDDIPFSRYLSPPLTTIRAPIEQVGQEAVRQLACLVRGEGVEPLIVLPTELVIRQSCGCK